MVRPAAPIPPEWSPRRALWCGWPTHAVYWPGAFEGARDEVAAFVRAALAAAPVNLAAGTEAALAAAKNQIGDGVRYHLVPMGDIWLRDVGPLFAPRPGGGLTAHSFAFNGWGGKYEMAGDTETAPAIAAIEGAALARHEFVFEPGAADWDGDSTVLATRQCLLNPNRNPAWSEDDANAALKKLYGAERVVWLDEGLVGDHTDGHADNVARFIGPGRVVCQSPSSEADPNAEILRAIERSLRGAGLDVETIPSPGRIAGADGAPAPASHLNFVILNDAVIVPVFEDRAAAAACEALGALFPDRTVIGLPAGNILTGGGAFHCMTCETPAMPEEAAA